MRFNKTWQRCLIGIQAGFPVDLSVDRLGFHDPDAQTYHLGLSDEVMLPLWRHHRDAVCEILRRVARAAREAVSGGQTTLAVQFFCKSGRHRALSSSRLYPGRESEKWEGG